MQIYVLYNRKKNSTDGHFAFIKNFQPIYVYEEI